MSVREKLKMKYRIKEWYCWCRDSVEGGAISMG